jgi:cell shape-determining protein MreD
MFAFRQSRRSRFPGLFVLGVELANEMYDLSQQASLGATVLRWDEALKDLWNTMLWPTVLLFVGRYTDLFQHRRRTPASDKLQDG